MKRKQPDHWECRKLAVIWRKRYNNAKGLTFAGMFVTGASVLLALPLGFIVLAVVGLVAALSALCLAWSAWQINEALGRLQ